MLLYRAKRHLTVLFILLITFVAGHAQNANHSQPTWWFGESVGANFNFYRGTTQKLNNELTTPTAFHKGKGVRPYVSLLTEYRPNKTWGGMLNVAYDGRGGKFDGNIAPCNCPAELKTNISYLAIEPSLRIAPFASSFYLFAGPVFSFNLSKEFTYKQEKQIDRIGDWSDIRKTTFSAQAGAGIDLPLSSPANAMQIILSPFASFQTDIGHQPRSMESWSFYTIRGGVALKFGRSHKQASTTVIIEPVTPATILEKEVEFSVRAPKAVPSSRQVKETFPFRNSVFFNMGSSEIPSRYVMLTKSQADAFEEELLQEDQPNNLNSGRSARQMAIYYNILNIAGDRMRDNPQSTIVLSGASDKNPVEGKLMAENIKQYLVNVFGINSSRITTEGRDKPVIPSEQPGGTKELALLREGDRRVDIESHSPELLLQVGGNSFFKPILIKAIQTDPLDSHVIFIVNRATEVLRSWSVDLTDEQGRIQHYGPYTKDQASVPGNTILGNNKEGNYKVVMNGQTQKGRYVRKESYVSLVKTIAPLQEGLRYSILFDFDQSASIAAYEKFLADIVAPLIPENATVIIHGHTDIIGEENYNLSLSYERAMTAQHIMERAVSKAGKNGVKFESYGFGEDESMAPFGNGYPEERFYNRTVIIDIIPVLK
jgi:outer membrane protein OmpA-like peptidoglycan-associated protein